MFDFIICLVLNETEGDKINPVDKRNWWRAESEQETCEAVEEKLCRDVPLSTGFIVTLVIFTILMRGWMPANLH